MKTLQNIPPSLVESDNDRAMPPGGGLVVALSASIAFWGALVWLVLRH